MPPRHRRNDCAGIVELYGDGQEADLQEDEREVRINKRVQKDFGNVHVEIVDPSALGVERNLPRGRLDQLAVDLVQKVIDVVGHQVDNFEIERFLSGSSNAILHRIRSPLGVSPALLCDVLDDTD